MKGKYKHVKGGIYEVLYTGKIEADLTDVVIYQSDVDKKVWVRPTEEFLKRFERIGEVA